MKRSLKPQYIAFIAGLIASAICAIFIAIVSQDFIYSFLGFMVTLTACYFIFYYLLKEFIYNRIKVIYKSIYRFKTQYSADLKKLDLKSQDPLERVSNEVVDWMKNNRDEVNQLKEQENYRREFLGNVSHELKTPIQSIQGYIHTLLDGALEDEKVNRLFLTKASNSTDRLIELVDDLTKISALEGKKIELNIEKFDLLVLCDEVLELVENKAKKKDTVIKYKGNPKTVMVEADRAKIRQVLVNLVVNALKYGKNRGVVLIGFYDMDKNILTEISDEGEGIAQEHIPRLFERFYRTDKGRSRDQGGSGLGLAIVKHILEAHKQTVNVRSTIGMGSTFGFSLKKG